MRVGNALCSLFLLLVPVAGFAAAKGGGGGAASVVQAWASALQARDIVRLRSMMAPDATYSRLELVGGDKIKRWGAGNVTPELFARSAEVYVVKVRQLNSGDALGIVSEVLEEGEVREWESWLTLRPGGATGWQVAQITDIAMEGSYPGEPEGCPETSAKRNESITLYGKLEGPGSDHIIRIFQTRRDTDAWAFATGEAAEEAKKCTPKPGLSLEDLEVVVHESSGALRGYQRFGRIDRTTGGGGRGIGLYTGAGGGALVAGGARIYGLPGGAEYLFLGRAWMSEKSQSDWRAVYRVDAYRWDSGAFRKVWGFDFGKEGGSITGGGSGKVLWSLSAPTPDGVVRASVAGGDTGCSGSIDFTWAGSGFKARKEGVSGGCAGSWWPGGEGSILGMGEVNLEKIAKKAGKRGVEEE